MKMNKWWVVLLVLFLAAVLLSILVNRQSRQITAFSQQETAVAAIRTETMPAYSVPAAQPASKPAVLNRRGITIVKPASAVSKEEAKPVPKIADKSSNNLTNLSTAAANFTSPEPLAPGVTKTGKIPSDKESKEMNSAGIVMY